MEKIKLFKKRTFGETIGTAFELLRQNFKLISLSFLYIVMPVLALSMLTASIGLIGLIKNAVAAGNGKTISNNSYAQHGITIAVGYVGYLITLFIQSVVLHEVVMTYELSEDPKKNNVADVWKLIKSDMSNILGSFFGLFPLWFALVFIAVMIYTFSAGISDSAAGLSILIMYFAGVYLSVCMSNFLMLRLRSEYGLLAAFTTSVTLTFGKWRWWKTLAILCVMTFIVFCFYTVSLYPFTIALYLFRLHWFDIMPREDYLKYLYIIMGLGFAYIGIIFSYLTNLVLLGTTVNYYSLIEDKEHVGLQVDIEQLGLDTNIKTQEGDY